MSSDIEQSLKLLAMVFVMSIVIAIVSIIRGKPNRKLILKREINVWFRVFGFLSIFSMMQITAIAVMYFMLIPYDTKFVSMLSTDVFSTEGWIVYLQGCSVSLIILFIGCMLILLFYGIRKKTRPITIWHYTDEELKILEDERIKSKEKFKKKFPKLYAILNWKKEKKSDKI